MLVTFGKPEPFVRLAYLISVAIQAGSAKTKRHVGDKHQPTAQRSLVSKLNNDKLTNRIGWTASSSGVDLPSVLLSIGGGVSTYQTCST